MATNDTHVAPEPENVLSGKSTADVFARMLIPVDFSASSRTALAVGLSIAEQWNSEVLLLHASGFDENDEFLDHTGVPWGRSDVLGDAHDHLIRFADAVVVGSSKHVRVEAVRDEDPIRAIVEAYERYAPSVVVVGFEAPGPRHWRRTQAEKLVRALACTVLLVQGEPPTKMDADS